MINGSISVDSGSVSTHRDSYLLHNLNVVSVRRPLFGMSMLYSFGLFGFAISFADLLFVHELVLIVIASFLIAIIGWQIGQLKLLSKDLNGSELSDVVWGTYKELNQVRRQIADAMRSHRKGVEV